MALLLNRLKSLRVPVIKGCRALIDQKYCAPEFVLQEVDLINEDKDFLKTICEKEFLKKFGAIPSLSAVFSPDKALRRFAIVLPLYVTNDKVIPMPFIVDTGAPDAMYLGTGAIEGLKKAQVIEDVSFRWMEFRLLGNLVRGERSIKHPYATALPLQYEEVSIRGDPRLNVLGLPTIVDLCIKIDVDLIMPS